ncbi:hypothetical protein LY76DRAFT_525255 [Colletotrichum caudatum]|nr:hypothetical protein LY76DRAFT_525255 [Colletotrichum caudatum]
MASSSALLCLLGFAAAVLAGLLRPQVLAADDVLVLNHDRTSRIMKAAHYEALETAAAAAAPAPLANITGAPGVVRRGCEKSTEVQVLSDDSFLDSDVAMSPLVSSAGGDAIVSIEDGFQLSENLKFKGQIEFGRKGVSISLDKKFDRTWTTTQTNLVRFTLPPNKYGLVVSQPYVRRVQGLVLSGCTDSPTKTPFVADSYDSQAFGSLSWVKGVIRMCSSETYPVPYCNGDGHHA